MRKVITASAIGVLGLLMAAGNVFAATTISGNGVGSHNTVVQKSKTLSFTDQTNIANFSNHVNTNTNTGNNKANKNTGGDVVLVGGSSNATVGITNVANSNTNTATNSCCPCSQLGDATITGNGVWSHNTIVDVTKCVTKLDQTNVANISNSVNTNSNTGNNSASYNTGGDVSVASGDATTSVTVSNVANSNSSN